MQIGTICTREVICAKSATSVSAAAKLMRQYHIGDVVVIKESGGHRVPLGIVTDRDIVLSVVATELDASTITIGDIMGPALVTATETDDILDAVRQMRTSGVRRMPVVDQHGALTGIVSVDDVIANMADQMNELTRLIAQQRVDERETRR
jgi:CBS domain-containing protein